MRQKYLYLRRSRRPLFERICKATQSVVEKTTRSVSFVHAKPWAAKDAAAITRRDLISFLDEVKRAAPVQANRIQSVVCGLFNWAVEDEILDANPIARLKKRAKEAASTRVLSDVEIWVLWRALDNTEETSAEIATALRVLLLVGQRPGEVAGAVQAELKNIDEPKNARWEIAAERMKARRPHVVPLTPMARELFSNMLARRREEDDKTGIFASRFIGRATLARHSLSQALRRVITRLSPEDVNADVIRSLQNDPPTPHDFRRTVATGLAALGIPREDRLAVLAHQASDIHGAVYDKYERLREKRIALERWEHHVATILGERKQSRVGASLDAAMTAPPKLEPMTAPPKLERLIEALRRLGDAVVAEEHAGIILARMIDVITPARGHDIGRDVDAYYARPRGQTAGLARELRDLAGKARKAAGGGKLAFEAWLAAWAALPRRTQQLLWRPPVPRLTLAEEESSFKSRTIDRRALAGSFATPRFHMVVPKAELILPAIEAELVRLKGTDLRRGVSASVTRSSGPRSRRSVMPIKS